MGKGRGPAPWENHVSAHGSDLYIATYDINVRYYFVTDAISCHYVKTLT